LEGWKVTYVLGLSYAINSVLLIVYYSILDDLA
jgi:hypothetical protein